MKKKLLSIISTALVLGVCLTSGLTAKAAGSFSPFFEGDVYEQPRLVDQADLLSDSEEQAILNLLNQVSTKYNIDVVVVTVKEASYGISEYSDDFYDYHSYNHDGIMLLLSDAERDWDISTSGEGISAFTDYGCNYISDTLLPSLKINDYYSAFTQFASLCDDFMNQYRNGEAYDVKNQVGAGETPFAWARNLIISILAGLGIGGIRASSLKSQLKSVHQQVGASQYAKENSLNVTVDRELYLYRNLTRTEKPQSTSGGSSTHTSSSGNTHGGSHGKY